MNYVTLYQLKQYLKIETSNTTDDELLKTFILWSSDLIDYWKGRRFDVFKSNYMLDTPMVGNKPYGDFYSNEFTAIERQFSNKELYLNVEQFDLLQVIELLNGDGAEIISSKYILEPMKFSKKNRIILRKGSGINWLPDSDGDARQAISLTGFFGFNRNYPNCFVDTGITLATEMNASVTSFSFADTALAAKDLISPRVQVGQMLRLVSVNGTEFLYVTSITDGGTGNPDTVEFVRSYNGTDAVIHPSGTKVEVYRPDNDIVQMATQLSRWRYRNKDVDNFDRTYNLATQTASTPSALPADVRLILGARRPQL